MSLSVANNLPYSTYKSGAEARTNRQHVCRRTSRATSTWRKRIEACIQGRREEHCMCHLRDQEEELLIVLVRQNQYKVIAKVRNSGKLSSQKIIEELPRKVPEGHKVSLTSPDLIVFVSVFKVCGSSSLYKPWLTLFNIERFIVDRGNKRFAQV